MNFFLEYHSLPGIENLYHDFTLYHRFLLLDFSIALSVRPSFYFRYHDQSLILLSLLSSVFLAVIEVSIVII